MIIVSVLESGCLEKGRPSIRGRTCVFVPKIRVSLEDSKDVNAYVDKNKENLRKTGLVKDTLRI